MGFGFRCRNDSGTFQIDGVFKQFVLRRKAVFTTNIDQYGTVVNFSLGTFTLDSDEIVALRSDTPCAITSKAGSVAYVASKGLSGTVIEAYIFGPVTDIGSTMGLLVRDASGVLMFDAMQKCLRMVGFPQGQGSFTFDTGRRYAALCLNQYLSITDTLTGSGGFYTKHRTTTRGMVQGIPGGISIANCLHYDDDSEDPNSGSVDETLTSSAPNRHIIIDVTNY